MLLLKFNEQIISDFLIPSFRLKKGELAIIQFPSGPYFYPLMTEMADIFKGKTANDKVEILSPFKYPEHIKERGFRDRLFPLTVDGYLKKYANRESPFATKIYDDPSITPKTRIRTLLGGIRRKLAVYATLSWTSQIIFDLSGVDPQSGQEIYTTVKGVVDSGGAAIFIDLCDEFKNDCTVFVKAEYVGKPL